MTMRKSLLGILKVVSSLYEFATAAWRESVIIELSDHLSVLLDSGVPLLEGVRHLLQIGRRRFAKKFLMETGRVLESGAPLSEAWQGQISALFWSVIQSGERSGKLSVVLKKHVVYVRARRQWSVQILRVIAYPFMLLIMTSLLLIYVADVVLPMFQNMYEELGYQVSEGTSVIIHVLHSVPIVFFYTFIFLTLFGLSLLIDFVRKKVYLHMPGRSLILLTKTRDLSSHLALLLSAGMPLVTALSALQFAKRPRWLSRAARSAKEQILSGSPVSSVFSYGWDEILPVMLHTAEKTGDLVTAFEQTEMYAQLNLHKRMTRLARILEPCLLFIMGGVVGMTIYAVFIPMYDFINVVSSVHR